MSIRFAWAALGIFIVAPMAPAQKFEAASVRLSKDPEPGGDVEITPGRFRGKDLALQWLILVAYRLPSKNLSGELPDWTISQRYDIDARTGDAAGEGAVLVALQNLLAERFGLRVRREMKEEPVYFLTVAKGGAKMPEGHCTPVKQDLPNECYSQSSDGLVTTMEWRGVRMSDGEGVSHRTFVGHFAGLNNRVVIDKTGLAGTYDVRLKWARDPGPGEAADGRAPSIFDAMEEQLGLKLESGRAPAEHVVVEHVEKPGAN